MSGISVLRDAYVLLPLVFALDLAALHVTGDHPLALRWWWRRSSTQPAASARVAS